MILFLLWITLITYVIFSYFTFRKNLLSPSLIVGVVYFFSCTICILECRKWGFILDVKTYFLILLSLIIVFIGDFFASKLKPFVKEKPNKKELSIDNFFLFIGFLIVTITFVLFLIETVRLSLLYYGTTDRLLENIKYIILEGNYNINYLVQHLYTLSEVIVSVFIFYILYCKIKKKYFIRNVFIYIAIVLFIFNVIITATRSKVINLFIYTFVISMFLSYTEKKEFRKKNVNKIFEIFIPSFMVFLILFCIAGSLTGKSSEYNNIWDNITNYTASSLYNFNDYVVNKRFYKESPFFGAYTFSGIYSLLRELGMQIPNDIIALEYNKVWNFTSNIYTPLRRYYQDFGIIGLCIILFTISFFYKTIIKNVKSHNLLYTMLISFFIYPLFYFSIEERFFMDVICMRSIYQVIYFIIIYNVFFKIKVFNRRVN